jgi:replicative DNA helicase
LEYQVISKIVETQDFHAVERLKINEDFFFSDECKTVFNYIWTHFHQSTTFGCVPSWQIIHGIFPNFPATPSNDTLATLCEQLRLAKMRLELLGIADKVGQQADYNPREGLRFLREAAANLSSQHEITNDMSLDSAYDVLMKDYQLVATGRGLTGLPWPWHELNMATQGIHPGDFIPLYGRPKNMKTWVALFIAVVLNVHANARVLVYSLEMNPKQIVRRAAALRSVVNYAKLIMGQLQQADYHRFFEQLKILQVEAQQARQAGVGPRTASFLVTSGEGEGGISFLHSKIREFKPDFVLVDGMYLMRDDRQRKRTIDWKAIAHISQDMKIAAREFEIPIMATCQANRKADKNAKKADLEEIAYADAIGQDADFTIRVQKRIDKSTKEPEVVLAFPGSREVDLDAFLIHGIPALNFGMKSLNVGKSDDDDGDKQQKKKGQPPTIQASRLMGA